MTTRVTRSLTGGAQPDPGRCWARHSVAGVAMQACTEGRSRSDESTSAAAEAETTPRYGANAPPCTPR